MTATGTKRAARLALALLLGAAAAGLLVACGSSGKGLIPSSLGEPLQSDIEAVDQAAESGDGNCTATEEALQKTEQDYAALPSSVDSGLRSNIHQGIENLRKVALNACNQPIAKTTTTKTQTTTTTTPTTTKTTAPPTTTTTKTTTTPVTPPSEENEQSGPGGGTPAPGEGNGKSPGEGSGGVGAEEAPAAEGPAK
jgi:hypothetical protein